VVAQLRSRVHLGCCCLEAQRALQAETAT
jgi:hypothetical protein